MAFTLFGLLADVLLPFSGGPAAATILTPFLSRDGGSLTAAIAF